MSTIELKLLDAKLRSEPELRPKRATAGAAAYDLRACIEATKVIEPDATAKVPTGIAIHIADPALCALVVPRSGLGIKHGIVLANLVGLIDSDYQGEITANLWNRSKESFVLEPYMRICQLLFVPVAHRDFALVEDFSNASERGEGGFGSTGTG